MTKIEEVARAILRDEIEREPAAWETPEPEWDVDALKCHGFWWQARAAIAAMREPTPAIMSALIDAVNDWQREEGEDADILRKVIDTALSEEG